MRRHLTYAPPFKFYCTTISPESSLVAKHAALVEQAVFSTNTTDEAYRDKVRSLFANLRDPSNPSLRLRVLAGELAAERLCGMSAQELKSRERVEEEERIRAENCRRG